MKILIFVKEVPDILIPLVLGGSAKEVRKEWTVSRMEPADRSAIEMALTIKDAHITLIHLGPGEEPLRQGLALGADEGIRIEGSDTLHAPAKALIFARVARILGFDLIFTGAQSRDTGSGQLGILLASHLNLPYGGPVVRCEVSEKVIATRMLPGGYQETIESSLPMVMATAALTPKEDPITLDARHIEHWDLPEIGLSDRMIRDAEHLAFGPLTGPVSKLHYAHAPDSSLPAHLRIRKLIEGTVATREGKVVSENSADALFLTLKNEGWLDHLKGGA